MATENPSSLHVVLVQNQFPVETHWGGISTFGWFMSAALAREGARVSVICQSAKNELEPVHSVSKQIQVYRIPGTQPMKGFRKLTAIFSRDKKHWFSYNVNLLLQDWLKQGNTFDIVDAADYLGGAAYLLKNKQRSVPVVVTCHTPAFLADEMNEGNHSKAVYSSKKIYRLEQFAIRYANGLLAPSHRISNLLSAKTGRSLNDFFTNPYPFPLQQEIQSRPKEVDIPQPFVLFTGRIERRKGIERLLSAWNKSAFKGDFTLVFAGKKTNHFPEFEQQALGMTGTSILFIGSQEREELAWLYRNASLVILPSEPFENYPYSCIESMAYSAPTLVSDSGGMSEMIIDEENGWVFRTGDTEHLREKIDLILNLPWSERFERGQKAQLTIRRINDPQRIASRTLKFYNRVIEDFER